MIKLWMNYAFKFDWDWSTIIKIFVSLFTLENITLSRNEIMTKLISLLTDKTFLVDNENWIFLIYFQIWKNNNEFLNL